MDTPSARLKWARLNRTNFSTATEAARAFGWVVPTYLGHENGDRNPSRQAAKKYAAAYKIPWAWILEGGQLSEARGIERRRTPREDRTEPEPQLPVTSIVAAGDEIVDGEGDPIDYEPAPPGLYDGEVTEVRGRSMLPIFRDGDRLFHKVITEDPTSLIGEAAVLRLKDGRRFIKVLMPGNKRGRYTLTSLNPAYPPMEDQAVVSAARIVWVKKSQK